VAGNRVQNAAKTAVCTRFDAINLSVVPPQQREVAKPVRFDSDLEHVFILLFN
jgi:hypothetical protein